MCDRRFTVFDSTPGGKALVTENDVGVDAIDAEKQGQMKDSSKHLE